MNSGLFERLAATSRLPSPSAAALRVLELVEKEQATAAEVADVLATDPAISLRVLKYANSPMVAPRAGVSNLQQAVSLLGLQAVKITALSFSLVGQRESRCAHFNYDLFWAHSIGTALAARNHLEGEYGADTDDAFMAGLFARIGRLVLAVGAPDEYGPVLKKIGDLCLEGVAEEQAALGTDHVALGAEVLTHWRVPTRLVEAVRHHLSPDSAPDEASRKLARAVRGAQDVARVLCGQVSRKAAAAEGDSGNEIAPALRQQFNDLAAMMNVSLDALPRPDELMDRARDAVAELSVASQVEKRELEHRAMSDALTGVGNRAAFEQHLAAEVARTHRYGRPLSLLMIDIDRFKLVNDRHGHPAGDCVLRSIGEALRETLRKSDIATRYGGEEFAVIATETDFTAAVTLAERLRSVIEARPIETSAGTVRVTVSIGVAAMCEKTLLGAAQFVTFADRLLYRAKQSGRNRCCAAALNSDTAARTTSTPI